MEAVVHQVGVHAGETTRAAVDRIVLGSPESFAPEIVASAVARSAPYVEVPFESEDQWHATRAQGIGSSESAGILGISPYPEQTAAAIFDFKKGRAPRPDFSQNAAVQAGIAYEDGVARLAAAELGHKLRPLQFRDERGMHGVVLRHAAYPWLQASPDRLDDDEDAVVECKTAGIVNAAAIHDEEWGEPGTDEIPEHYLVQVMHQLIVTGRQRWYLAVQFGGRPFALYTGERNEALIAAMIRKLGRFWLEHIVADVPPPIATPDDARRRFPLSQKRTVVAPISILDAIAERNAVKREIDALAKRKDRLEACVMAFLGDAEEATDGRDWLARWPQSRELDKDRAFERYPEAAAACVKRTIDAAALKKTVGAKAYEQLLKPAGRRFTVNEEYR